MVYINNDIWSKHFLIFWVALLSCDHPVLSRKKKKKEKCIWCIHACLVLVGALNIGGRLTKRRNGFLGFASMFYSFTHPGKLVVVYTCHIVSSVPCNVLWADPMVEGWFKKRGKWTGWSGSNSGALLLCGWLFFFFFKDPTDTKEFPSCDLLWRSSGGLESWLVEDSFNAIWSKSISKIRSNGS